MPNRIFQNVVTQMKTKKGQRIGVIDRDGLVIACDDIGQVGKSRPDVAAVINGAKGACVTWDGYTYKALPCVGASFDFACFTEGTDDTAGSLCQVAAVAFDCAKQGYEEKHNTGTFVKNIILDNVLFGDAYTRAKELHFDCEATRGVILVHMAEATEISVVDLIRTVCPDRENDFVISVTETDAAVVKTLEANCEENYLEKLAQKIAGAISEKLKVDLMIGIGTVVSDVRDLARSYQEAQLAIEVGKVFDVERTINSYDNLGIGRLIYQLPTTLCEMFLNEVFKKNPIDAVDSETLATINKFFENNLNVSETARKLFVHRNTLVYRLEKIKKLTGLDLREFDDAITFKVALMVKKYLTSRGIEH